MTQNEFQMVTKVEVITLFFLVNLFTFACAHSPPRRDVSNDSSHAATGCIGGSVILAHGTPAKNASVWITNVASTRADSSGRFLICDLAPDSYTLLIGAPGTQLQKIVEVAVKVDSISVLENVILRSADHPVFPMPRSWDKMYLPLTQKNRQRFSDKHK
jgi:hypothetical protein